MGVGFVHWRLMFVRWQVLSPGRNVAAESGIWIAESAHSRFAKGSSDSGWAVARGESQMPGLMPSAHTNELASKRLGVAGYRIAHSLCDLTPCTGSTLESFVVGVVFNTHIGRGNGVADDPIAAC